MLRYVVLGAGAAGMAACEAIRNQDRLGKIVLVSEEPEGYYSRPGLAYLLTGEIPEKLLFPVSPAEFDQSGIERLHAQARRIDLASRQAIFTNGQSIPYDRLLIATGSQATPLNIPNMDAEGIVKLDNLADARRILSLARKAHSAVVVGGGITALEIVEGLRARGLKPDYFLRGDRYWSNVLDETESRIVEESLKEEGVRIHVHTELAEVLTHKGRIKAVRSKDGRQFRCDLLAVAIGVQPRIELARDAGLQVNKGILVDEYLQTSQAGVFAAGDVAEALDANTGRRTLNTLWFLARNQGRIAGLNMSAGDEAGFTMQPYQPGIPFNVTRLAGLTTTIIGAVGNGRDEDLSGIARGDSETWRQLPDALAAQANFKVNRLRLLIGNDRLIGAIVMGDQTLSRPLQHLIARQVDITPIRQALLQPDAPVADIVADFWARLHP